MSVDGHLDEVYLVIVCHVRNVSHGKLGCARGRVCSGYIMWDLSLVGLAGPSPGHP